MPRVARTVAPMTIVAMLMAGAVAFSSADLRYSGVTSQGLPAGPGVNGHGVSFFWIQLRERCYTRQGRFVGRFGAGYSFTSFPPLTIGSRGRFSHREGGNNLLYGVVHGRTAPSTCWAVKSRPRKGSMRDWQGPLVRAGALTCQRGLPEGTLSGSRPRDCQGLAQSRSGRAPRFARPQGRARHHARRMLQAVWHQVAGPATNGAQLISRDRWFTGSEEVV